MFGDALWKRLKIPRLRVTLVATLTIFTFYFMVTQLLPLTETRYRKITGLPTSKQSWSIDVTSSEYAPTIMGHNSSEQLNNSTESVYVENHQNSPHPMPMFLTSSKMAPSTAKRISSSVLNLNRKAVHLYDHRVKGDNSLNRMKGSLLLTVYGTGASSLGNQMFQYASLLGIARAQGREPFLEPGLGLERAFELTHLAEYGWKEITKWPVIKEIGHGKLDTNLMNISGNPILFGHNVTISGYLQSWKYFGAIEDEIRREFTFRNSTRVQTMAKLNKIRRQNAIDCLLIGVHVRRGDFLQEEQRTMGYGTPNRTYFLKAFDWMKKRLEGKFLRFIVISDDRPWCDKNLRDSDVIVMPSGPPHSDLALLAHCDHVIISGGTFGWWGAWLAKGLVVYYAGHPVKGSPLSRGMELDDYYPLHWIGLED